MNKRYIDKDGNFWNGVSIVLDGMRIFNPSEEQLEAAGYTEYVEPEPTPAELLERAKQQKIGEIVEYDQSDAVNQFFYQDIPMWLDKATRAGLLLRITAEQAAGDETTTLWFGTQSFEIPIAGAFQMLYAIEIYASQCYDKTAEHKAAVEALETIEEVEEYDYTVGYPEKLTFGSE